MRNKVNFNADWMFSKTATSAPQALPADWEKVSLPHTWNGKDGQDGGNDYYRGKCWYVKKLRKADFGAGERFYLELNGANSSAEVFLNGQKLAAHHGGYSAFRVNLTDALGDDNLLAVSVDNSPNDFVYPQMADFTFYGGLYRDVNLIAVSRSHFDLDYYGAPGIQVTPTVNGNAATVAVRAFVTDAAAAQTVRFTITDGETKIAEQTVPASAPSASIEIKNVHLWHGVSDPHLYHLQAELCDGENTIDAVQTRFGCRSFRVDPDKGFFLNGKSYPLRGVARHQDRPEIGNALSYAHHAEDVALICEMGANTVRLAHYQHAQDFYDLCDEKGLVVWAEIPYISSHMKNGRENTLSQMTELIVQNYNHASIVCWGLSNEITISGTKDPTLLENHKALNDLCHKTDSTRLTTLAVVTVCSPDADYAAVPDILSYNHYFGWYGGTCDMYGPWFDRFHKKYPHRAVGISEYGCEALNWHTSEPTQGDYTEEYQAYYHEELIKQIAERPYLWATHVWNMFDFAADARAEGGENGMNHKGLVTFDRQYRKDAFYAYKAWLSDEPMLHICGKRYTDRAEPTAKITVYSNQPQVELFANGKSIAKQKKSKYPFFYFDVPNSGETELKAVAGDLTDTSCLRKVQQFNEAYRMKEEGAVINWFEIDTPPGYYSVNDTIGDILSTFKGKIFALKVVKMLLSDKKDAKKDGKKKEKGISVMGMKINKTVLEMAKGFTVRRALSMAGSMFTKEQILTINKELNKIKKR